jgi:glycosyltransferase involved in cell wall biosynthesis
MKNVLIVTNRFPPDSGAGPVRATKFTKFLLEFGWRPIVLTVPANGIIEETWLNSIPIYRAVAPNLAWLFALARHFFPQQVKQSATPTITGFRGRKRKWTSWFLAPDDVITWLPSAVRLGLKIAHQHKIEAIVSSSPSPTCHLVALILSKLWHCGWVADFRDPWMTDPSGFYPTKLHQNINAALERLVVRHAHSVVTVSTVLRNDFVMQYPTLAADKFRVITNGFDPDDFLDVPARTKPRSIIQIVHNGSFFYSDKDPFPFLQAVRLLADLGELANVEIYFVGVPVDKLAPVIREMDLDQVVKLIERLPHKKSLEYVMNADILLLISGPKRGVLTAKVFEYLATFKLILALTPSQGILADLLNQANVAEIVDPYSPQDIAKGLKKLIGQVQTGQLPIPNREFIQQFHRRNQTRLLAAYLDEIRQTQNQTAKELTS